MAFLALSVLEQYWCVEVVREPLGMYRELQVIKSL